MLFRKVLFATDFSDVSEGARAYVLKLAQAGCREVIVVHVIDGKKTNVVLAEPSGFISPSGEYEQQLASRLRTAAERSLDQERIAFEKAGLIVRTHILEGMPPREIIRIADAEQVNLIVLGSHGKSNLLHSLLGSVTERVLHNAHQPVLVVRRGYIPDDD